MTVSLLINSWITEGYLSVNSITTRVFGVIRLIANRLRLFFAKSRRMRPHSKNHYHYVNSINIYPLRIILILSLLVENKLCLLSIIKMILSPKGIIFIYNRRREIISVFSKLKFNVGTRL